MLSRHFTLIAPLRCPAGQVASPRSHMTMLRRVIAASAIAVTVTMPAAAQSTRALELEDVITLTRLSGVDDATRIAVIQKRCVSFPVDAGATERLRGAGASAEVVGALQTACFTGAELVAEANVGDARLRIDGQPAGAPPATRRFANGGSHYVEATALGKRLGSEVFLQPGRRTRIAFGFAPDTMPLPRVRTPLAIASALNLEGRWTPTSASPAVPTEPGVSPDWPIVWPTLIGAAIGAAVAPKFSDPAAASKSEATVGGALLGGLGGLIIIAPLNGSILSSRHKRRVRAYQEAIAAREAWERKNAMERQRWMESHPDVQQVVENERRALEEAQAANARTREAAAAIRPIDITSQPLPGPR